VEYLRKVDHVPDRLSEHLEVREFDTDLKVAAVTMYDSVYDAVGIIIIIIIIMAITMFMVLSS